MNKAFFFGLFIAIFAFSTVDSKYIKGHIKTGSESSNNWVPFTQFYFGGGKNNNRTITWKVETQTLNNLTLVVYDDETEDWNYVWKNRKSRSCQEKIDPKNNSNYLTRIIPITRETLGKFQTIDILEEYARKWVMVFADCGGNSLDIQYSFTFLNIGGKHEKQFSLEEQGLYGLYIAFFIFFLILLGAHLVEVVMLYRAQSFHNVVKLLTITISLEFFSILFKMGHYASYSTNGVGSYGSHVFGSLLGFFSEMAFILLLILLARGYAVSTSDFGNKRNLIIALVSYLVFFFIWWAWKIAEMHVPLYPMFSWGTIPGILFLLTRIICLGYVLYQLRYTHLVEGHPIKRKFYVMFAGLSVAWFLYIPFVVCFTALIYLHSSWMLDKSVTGNFLALNLLVYSYMVFLFWPTQITKYFDLNKSDMLISSNSPTSPYETL